MALDADGRILAIRAQARHAVGAYFIGAGLVPTVFAMRFIPGPYDVQAIHVMAQGLFTNTSPIGPYRGAGRPEAVYVTERLLDQAARRIGIDRDEIRRRNLIPMERLPYTTQTHYSYDSGEFHRLMALCMERADWPGYAARCAASAAAGKLRGRAITYYIEQGGVFNERMELRFDPGGSVTIVAGTFSHGQGHATTFAQMVSDWLGVPFETIRFVQGDTDKVPFGRGTYAARSSMLGGCALRAAADVVIEKARHMAAALMEAAAEDVEFAEGAFRIAGTDRAMTMTDVAKAFYYPMGITDKFGVGLEGSGTFTTEPPNHPNGCHICELEIDPQTGAVAIDRYTIVDDVGIVINPLICAGQVHGGLAQGIGQALLEHALYDRASGQFLSGSFMDYGMPRADMFPDFKTRFEEIPATTNPLGIKGIGEAGAIGAPATIVNAIIDALTPLGIAHIDMPATPGKIWESVQRATA
jgi:carbon-monoxide dehydrogenase large subunit